MHRKNFHIDNDNTKDWFIHWYDTFESFMTGLVSKPDDHNTAAVINDWRQATQERKTTAVESFLAPVFALSDVVSRTGVISPEQALTVLSNNAEPLADFTSTLGDNKIGLKGAEGVELFLQLALADFPNVNGAHDTVEARAQRCADFVTKITPLCQQRQVMLGETIAKLDALCGVEAAA